MAKNSIKHSFSKREREIASLLAKGCSEKEIADELNISPATVSNHMSNIRSKNGLTKNIEIVLLYISELNNKPFSLKKIREFGVSIILVMINLCGLHQI